VGIAATSDRVCLSAVHIELVRRQRTVYACGLMRRRSRIELVLAIAFACAASLGNDKCAQTDATQEEWEAAQSARDAYEACRREYESDAESACAGEKGRYEAELRRYEEAARLAGDCEPSAADCLPELER
jgi:hypothetical protein